MEIHVNSKISTTLYTYKQENRRRIVTHSMRYYLFYILIVIQSKSCNLFDIIMCQNLLMMIKRH